MSYNKFRVAPKADRTFNGKVYASKAEAQRARELKVWCETEGTTVTPQPRFHLGCPENTYVADFHCRTAPGDTALLVTFDGKEHRLTEWVEDVKGVETAKFKRDVKLWRAYGPCVLVILKRRGNTWKREYVVPGEPAPKIKRTRRIAPRKPERS